MWIRRGLVIGCVVVLLTGCGAGNHVRSAPPHARPLPRFGMQAPQRPTRICGQPAIFLQHVITPTYLHTSGPPRTVSGHVFAAHLFRVAHGCSHGATIEATPHRCALPGHPALATDGLPIAILYIARCPYTVTVALHVAAHVHVPRPWDPAGKP
jgi:hypothetical protein